MYNCLEIVDLELKNTALAEGDILGIIQPLPVKHDTFKNVKTRKLGHQIQFT